MKYEWKKHKKNLYIPKQRSELFKGAETLMVVAGLSGFIVGGHWYSVIYVKPRN